MAVINDWVELTHTDDSKVLWVKRDKVDMVMVRKERPEDPKNQDFLVTFQLLGFDGDFALEESLQKPFKSQEAAREWVRRFLTKTAA